MVNGLELFLRRFQGLEDCFILIGGTACDLWMTDKGLSFRARSHNPRAVSDPVEGARAHLDLVQRKATGAHVDSDELKKHRNDIFRLFLTLAPADRHLLPQQLRDDLAQFAKLFSPDSEDWPKIQAAVKDLPDPKQVIDQLRDNFGL